MQHAHEIPYCQIIEKNVACASLEDGGLIDRIQLNIFRLSCCKRAGRAAVVLSFIFCGCCISLSSHFYKPFSHRLRSFFSFFRCCKNRFGVSTKLAAEWKPAEGAKWEETNFEKEITKLEKEAEERMEKKIEELKSKIGATGAK